MRIPVPVVVIVGIMLCALIVYAAFWNGSPQRNQSPEAAAIAVASLPPRFEWVKVMSDSRVLELNGVQAIRFGFDEHPGKARVVLHAESPIEVGAIATPETETVRNIDLVEAAEQSDCAHPAAFDIELECVTPAAPILVIHDARGLAAIPKVLIAGVSAIKSSKLEITSYRWRCVENCPITKPSTRQKAAPRR